MGGQRGGTSFNGDFCRRGCDLLLLMGKCCKSERWRASEDEMKTTTKIGMVLRGGGNEIALIV